MGYTIEAPATPRSNTRTPLADFVTFLRANPGQWAVYHTYTPKDSAKYACRRGRKKYGHEGFTFTFRHTDTGYTVYGKYTPPPLAFANTD